MIHIEFIGVNGAGKSTLYHQSNAYIAERLGYKPGPDQLWLRMVDDAAMQPAAIRESWAFRLLQTLDPKKKITRRLPANSENNYGFLSRAAVSKSELIRKFMQLNAAHLEAGSNCTPKAYEHWNLQYFFSLLTCHQTRLENAERELLMLDEGFVSVFTKYLVTDNGIDEALLTELLEKNFNIDHLFHVKAGVETCLKRLEVRGVPAPYRHLSRHEFKSFLARRDKDITQVCNRLSATRTQVVEVANDHSPQASLQAPSQASFQASFAMMRPHLDAIVARIRG